MSSDVISRKGLLTLDKIDAYECMLMLVMCKAAHAAVLGDEGVDAQSVYSWVVSEQIPSMSGDALSMQCKVPLRSSAAYVLAIAKHRPWVVAKFSLNPSGSARANLHNVNREPPRAAV